MSKNSAAIPMRFVGPIKILNLEKQAVELEVPLATFETPLWPSVARGASISRVADGIKVVIARSNMTRSILLEAEDAFSAVAAAQKIIAEQELLAAEVLKSSNFTKLLDVQVEVVGKLLYVRFSFSVADASGHNMVTKAADVLVDTILKQYASLRYVSVSANFCTDKKVSAVNGILGRGKHVIAEMVIKKEICENKLHVVPQKIVDLNLKKNLLGSVLAGSLRSANAHFANMLLAFYLATGQDAANIVEGSQGITSAELTKDGDLYFAVTLPNVIVGTVGAGKDLDFVQQNLEKLGCLEKREVGENGARLAKIVAATVWCGELSLLGALANRGELVKSHMRMERIGNS